MDKVPIFCFSYIFGNAQNNTGHTQCGLLALNCQETFEAEHKSANKIIFKLTVSFSAGN